MKRLPDSIGLAPTAYVLSAAIVGYTMVLSCFLDIGEPRQRRPTDVLILLMCFLGAHLWRVTTGLPATARSATAGDDAPDATSVDTT
jgi:hypothetical protein